ncbi:hypothetical protein H0H92_011032 [Tricholoma furcatifolium]|nr:hypothetical protein H0H92_011032 [Tricholoma furcatifolium]
MTDQDTTIGMGILAQNTTTTTVPLTLTPDAEVVVAVEVLVLHGNEDVLGQGQGQGRNPEREEKDVVFRALGLGQETEEGGDEESRRRRDKKKDKERKRSRSRERKKERKREKKDKKEKKKHKHTSGSHWGKYGVISEVDIFSKGPEFHTWLVEERKINPETISKDQSKKEFQRFVEDYNTATLPHEKYYNMEAYERRMSALRQGEFVPPPEDAYDPQADMKAIRNAHKKKVVEHDSYLSKEQLQELRRVQQERVEAGKMKLLGMEIRQNMGVRMDGTTFDD